LLDSCLRVLRKPLVLDEESSLLIWRWVCVEVGEHLYLHKPKYLQSDRSDEVSTPRLDQLLSSLHLDWTPLRVELHDDKLASQSLERIDRLYAADADAMPTADQRERVLQLQRQVRAVLKWLHAEQRRRVQGGEPTPPPTPLTISLHGLRTSSGRGKNFRSPLADFSEQQLGAALLAALPQLYSLPGCVGLSNIAQTFELQCNSAKHPRDGDFTVERKVRHLSQQLRRCPAMMLLPSALLTEDGAFGPLRYTALARSPNFGGVLQDALLLLQHTFSVTQGTPQAPVAEQEVGVSTARGSAAAAAPRALSPQAHARSVSPSDRAWNSVRSEGRRRVSARTRIAHAQPISPPTAVAHAAPAPTPLLGAGAPPSAAALAQEAMLLDEQMRRMHIHSEGREKKGRD
jgi:hypothetical protein